MCFPDRLEFIRELVREFLENPFSRLLRELGVDRRQKLLDRFSRDLLKWRPNRFLDFILKIEQFIDRVDVFCSIRDCCRAIIKCILFRAIHVLDLRGILVQLVLEGFELLRLFIQGLRGIAEVLDNRRLVVTHSWPPSLAATSPSLLILSFGIPFEPIRTALR